MLKIAITGFNFVGYSISGFMDYVLATYVHFACNVLHIRGLLLIFHSKL